MPIAVPEYNHIDDPDPLQLFLLNYDVSIPSQVYEEVEGLASDFRPEFFDTNSDAEPQSEEEFVSCAAEIIRQVEASHYQRVDPYSTATKHDEPPDWGLDKGETAAIVLSNDIDADLMISDDFKSKHQIKEKLSQTEWLSSFDVLCELVDNDIITKREGRRIGEEIEKARNWENTPYIQTLMFKHL